MSTAPRVPQTQARSAVPNIPDPPRPPAPNIQDVPRARDLTPDGFFTVRKRYTLEMSHQLTRAVSTACSDTIHGHSYVVEVFFTSHILNDDGMVVDFGALAEVRAVMEELDHALMMDTATDSLYVAALQRFNKKLILFDGNPTAEAMARYLFRRIITIGTGAFSRLLWKVRVHETATGWAEYQRGELPAGHPLPPSDDDDGEDWEAANG